MWSLKDFLSITFHLDFLVETEGDVTARSGQLVPPEGETKVEGDFLWLRVIKLFIEKSQ